jgi:hypothetical protein
MLFYVAPAPEVAVSCNPARRKTVLIIRQPYQFWTMLADRRDHTSFRVQALAC